MSKLFSIGEVSKILNISSKTLRNYDNLGLLIPNYIDTITGYRYYAYDQFFRIDVIRYLNKTMNIPLKEVSSLLSKNKYDNLISILENHHNALEEQICKLEYSKYLTMNLINDIQVKKRFPDETKIYEQYLMSRDLNYIKINAPLEEIDIYAKRNLGNILSQVGRENDLMCLIFDLNEFVKTNALNVKGFGFFSKEKNPELSNKYLQEGRYITHHFQYSDANAKLALNDLLAYSKQKGIKTDMWAFMLSKKVDLAAHSKYEYFMDLQILEKNS